MATADIYANKRKGADAHAHLLQLDLAAHAPVVHRANFCTGVDFSIRRVGKLYWLTYDFSDGVPSALLVSWSPMSFPRALFILILLVLVYVLFFLVVVVDQWNAGETASVDGKVTLIVASPTLFIAVMTVIALYQLCTRDPGVIGAKNIAEAKRERLQAAARLLEQEAARAASDRAATAGGESSFSYEREDSLAMARAAVPDASSVYERLVDSPTVRAGHHRHLQQPAAAPSSMAPRTAGGYQSTAAGPSKPSGGSTLSAGAEDPNLTDVVNPPTGAIVTVYRKRCTTCDVRRSLRGAHCHEAEVCIDAYDHFCGVTGTAVGRGNITAFMRFTTGCALSCNLIGAYCAYAFFATDDMRLRTRGAMAELGLFIISLLSVVPLNYGAWYMTYLYACFGSTLRERRRRGGLYQGFEFEDDWDRVPHPYDKGFCANVMGACGCGEFNHETLPPDDDADAALQKAQAEAARVDAIAPELRSPIGNY